MLLEKVEFKELRNMIVESLADAHDHVAIHAGHFYLACNDSCPYPLLSEELELQTNIPHAILQRAKKEIGTFPMGTFKFAIELYERLEGRGHIFTLVNDWGDVSMRRNTCARGVRESFYRRYANSETLKAFRLFAQHVGIEMNPLLMGPCKSSLVSETWLRRCFAKRVKKSGVARDHLGNVQFDGVACPVLVQGQANCAGEVAELLLQLRTMGFTRLVNFYPRVCGGYVKASSEIARELGLEGMKAVHIGLPCSGEENVEELLRLVDFTLEY